MSLAPAVFSAAAVVASIAALRGVRPRPSTRSLDARCRDALTVRRRRAALAAALPEAIRRLAAELTAGRSLERALASVGRATPAPLGPALEQAVREHAQGAPIEGALGAALPRDPASHALAAAVALHRRSGGDLPRLLRGLASSLDERARVEGEIRSLTAQARFSAVIVPLLPPVALLGLYLVDERGVQLLLTTPLGLMLVAAAAWLNVVGALVIARITRSIA